MKYFYPADILLPKKDFEKWAVIACDQYTSDLSYWKDVEKIVGDSPSALQMILPEAYLKGDNSENIQKINNTMQRYLEDDVFELHQNSMIYVERQIGDKVRKGLIGVIDLEEYDYNKDSNTLIRATEETVKDRLPARVQIRQDATLEMPHILLLFDDPTRSVVKPLELKKETLDTAYNFDLMKNGGHIHGWFLDEDAINGVHKALDNLYQNGDELLFVVGDGNHSLAAAKECYKKSGNPKARFALVEIENVYDNSIAFEPIYRVLFNVNEKDFLTKFQQYTEINGAEQIQHFEYFTSESGGVIDVKATAKLPIGTLQSFIDSYMKEHPKMKIDYIHGSEVVKSLCQGKNTLGFLFDGMTKDKLFASVRADGSLPRKTFSMGHADEKRFYIESRQIR